MRKLIALLVCFMLVLSFVGCNPATTTTTTTTTTAGTTGASQTTEATPGIKLPLVDPGSLTLKIATAENYYIPKSYSDNLPIYQEFEKLTGVKVAWEVIPGNEYGTVMQTRLAAASDLPDIMGATGNSTKLGQQGVILDLTDMIAKDAPYLDKLFEMNSTVKSATTAYDGKIYAYPGFGEGIITGANDMKVGSIEDPGANINPNVAGIRKDWLDKLGLQIPTTLDEFYDVLVAFKTKDPNGNNLADEIPISPTWSWENLYSFGDATGLYMSGNMYGYFEVAADGKLNYKYTDARYKETLKYINKLYTAGLIDPEYASSSFEKTSEKITRNLVGSVPREWMSNFPSWQNNLRAAGVTDAEWVAVRPLKNPDGKSITHNRWSIWLQSYITKDCKSPEIALQWLDMHCLSPEGITLQMFGVEGMSYTLVDGKPTYNDFVLKNPEGLGPFEAVRSIGGWCTSLPYIQTKEAYLGIFSADKNFLAFSAGFTADEVKQPFPGLNFTPEETEASAEAATNIDTYQREMATKFIEGKESIDGKWDEYVAQIDTLGLKTLTDTWQAAYNRFMGK